jgi:dolichyl-phosphate-mannose-protein mannosyltransferase
MKPEGGRMKKKFALVCMLALLFIFPMTAFAAGNLATNGGFEDVQADGPAGWTRDAYQQGADVSQLTLESGAAHSGNRFLRIRNVQPNDARWVQRVPVKPAAVYKLSCWVRASGIGAGGAGANISVLGVGNMSKDLKDTNGAWELVEFYGKTGKSQKELVVAARLGGYGNLNTGTADFDDFTLEEVQQAPAGTNVVSFSPDEQPQAGSGSHAGYNAFAILFAFLYLAACIRAIAYAGGQREGMLPFSKRGSHGVLALFIGAFAFRLLGAALVKGHPIDFADFSAWADHAYAAGLSGFYNGQMFADYPPGYIYILYIVGAVKHWFSIGDSSAAFTILLKLPAMAADLLASYLIYTAAQKQGNANGHNGQTALVLAFLYLLNPGVYINSAIWAQIDSVYTLAIMLMIFALMDNKLPKAAALFAVSLLIKPQAAIFAPLLLYSLIRRKHIKSWAHSFLAGALVFLLGVLPFSLHKQAFWIAGLYKSMFESYPYAALNAANLYTLFGLNGAQASGKWLFMTLDAWGNACVLLIVALTAYLFFKSRESSKHVYLAFLLSLLVFVLKTGMHERYGYPAVLLALLSYTYIKDKRILYLFVALSLTQFANVAYVLKFGLDQQYFIPGNDAFMKLISFGNVVLALYAVRVGWDIYVKGKIVAFMPVRTKPNSSPSTKPARRGAAGHAAGLPLPNATLTKKDQIAMTVLTLLYAAAALYQLGSLRAPQSSWQPELASESFYADFGQTAAVSAILWYGGIGDGEFQIEQSGDADHWTPALNVKLDGGTVFQWKQSPVAFSARFVKITAVKPGAVLYELAFVNDRKQPLPVSRLVPLNMGDAELAKAQHVFDESGAVPDQPSFMNSMYFDEIYHARTAYENLHRMEPFETTHPPLGKVLISLGIAIFGMNPFGWRIVGTLFGIAMIPLMYMWAKKMFGKTEYGFIAAFLLTFDFMHFTQTRIATIDVYGVFFIMLMYFLMYQYYALSLNRAPLKRALIPLGWSGLVFGIGSACKWIDLYAGGGLAVIVALVLYETCLRGKFKQCRRPFWITVGWCCIMFVAVPAAVYVLSYIPFLRVPGLGHDFKAILALQKFMYNYHTQLVATHPFSSAWWEWPLMRKPVWYYGQMQGALPPGETSSIVAMGNPAIWWIGIAAVILSIHIRMKTKDKVITFILVGLAAEYLPWIGVPRLTFIYHFFASVPFVILCITYVIKHWREHAGLTPRAVYVYLGAVLLLFVMFYPVLSGAAVSKAYVDHFLRWFPSWIF